MFVNRNWWGIGAATFAWWMFGYLWYGVIMTKAWMALEGVTPEMAQGKEWYMGLGVLQTAIVCIGLDWVRQVFAPKGVMDALRLGLWLGLFFSVSTIWLRFIYALEPLALIGIDSVYQLVGYGASMVILTSFSGFKKTT